ncbi:hypothetical protein [Actinomyces mediterranea]|uniref:hypothetical protein n=1 Tax=Actinomyces mediterranea TaxID=1871028 RepID=UPI00101AE12B|nr:hypothetical protein [Actinomyces mediterranea]
MSVEQVAFVIPPHIEAGLADGKLVRYGGIVRNETGHIVTHLKEVPPPKLDKALERARKLAATNKRALVAGVVVTVALVGTAITVKTIKQRKLGKAEIQVHKALSAYFEAIVAQDMNLSVIDKLQQALVDLREVTGKPINELLEGEALDSLIEYSRNFILRNSSEQLQQPELAQLTSLEDYLAEQRRIFSEAN